MAAVDIDNNNISPAGIRNKQAAALGYLLGVPLRPLATPPIVPAEKPLRIGQPIEPKITLGVPPAGMKPAPKPGTVGMLGGTPSPPESSLANRANESLRALTPGGSELMPAIGKPTRAESEAAGRLEYAEGLPQVTAAPGTADFYHQEAARLQYEKEHPWGSPISSHPGTLGKIGHTLATIGNIAGDILAPSRMAEIPGTQLHREIELGNAEKLGQQADEAEQRRGLNAARLGEVQAETGAAKTRQALNEQRLENLKRNPADKFLYHDTDANGKAVAVFEGRHGVYSVPVGYQSKNRATGRGGSDFDRYYRGLVSGGMPDTPQNRLKARKDWEAATRKPAGAGPRSEASTKRALASLESKKAAEYRKLKTAWRYNGKTGNYESVKRVPVYDTMGHRTGTKPEQVLTPDQYNALKQSIENEYANARTQLGFQTTPYEYAPAPAGMVAVQIPGQPVGHIPRGQLGRFRKAHPDAKVLSQ